MKRKGLFYTIGILLLLNIIIVATDHSYLYKGIANTYLKGRKGPGLFDLEVFPKRTIVSNNGSEIPSQKELIKLNDKQTETLEAIETNSFLILKNNTIISETHWSADTNVTNSFSVAKSIISILIGIAEKEGFISNVNESAGTFLPHFNEGKLKHITIRNLLSMSSGLHWIESGANPFSHNAKAYYGSELKALINSLEYEKAPGQYFEYKSGNSQVLAMILEEATGMNVSEFANVYLWNRINASSNAYWSLDQENGIEKAYCCFYATAVDFAKIGQLMLHKGVINGDTILTESYIKEAIQPANVLKVDGSVNKDYGLHWWVIDDYNGFTGYYARGILGQYIIVLPEQDLIIVRTGHKRLPKDDLYHPNDLYLYLDIVKELLANEERH